MVLVREAARGAYNRMTSSFLRLLSLMGITASSILGAIPIVGTGGLAIWESIRQRRELAQMQGHYGIGEAPFAAVSLLQPIPVRTRVAIPMMMHKLFII